MNFTWARPRSARGRLALWTALVALSSLSLLGRRPFEAWKDDLTRDQTERRILAAYALRDTPEGKVPGVLPMLAATSKDSNAELAEVARGTVRMLAPQAGPLLARVAANVDGPSAGEALELLALGGPETARHVADVLLVSPDARARCAGLDALADMKSAARGVLPDLERLARDPVPEVRRQALRALVRVDPDSPETFRAAQRATRDGDPGLRARAWRALALSPLLLERARDPALAPALAEALERELPALPPTLRTALDEGLRKAR